MPGIVFHRPARTYPERLPTADFVIVPPQPAPAAQPGGPASWMQYLIPILGSFGSVAFFLFSPVKQNPLLLIGVGGMIFASIGGGFLTRGQQRRQVKLQAKAYQKKYERYLTDVTTRLADLTQRQQAVGDLMAPELAHLLQRVQQRTRIWERRHNDDDFLQVRIGAGVVSLCSKPRVDFGTNPLADFHPELSARAQAIVAKYEHLDDAPITVALRAAGVVAISGPRNSARALARALVCQLAVAHAPDDLRVVLAFPHETTREWSWAKWLPHTRRMRQARSESPNAPELLCLMADNVEQLNEVLVGQLQPEIERRRKLREGNRERQNAPAPRPHILLVIEGYSPHGPLAQLPLVDELMHDGPELGVTTVCLVNDRGDEPSAARNRIELTDGGWLTFSETSFGGRRLEFITADSADLPTCEQIARALMPLSLAEESSAQDLSQDVRLLSLLHVPNAEAVRPADLWLPRSRQDLLRVPIGIGVDGAPLILDVKEAAEGGMGPHGLIIGATGSGKSELLRTIVTSLAMTHDPETLNFVLADFKGGASFADLAALPHAAGMITNLQSDLYLVDRMKAALSGEQERRQRMLREAGNLDNIRQYQQKRSQDRTLAPLPYLMIIVDEFAELLANRPDFLDLFVAIGRVGRSLGMHLLLATQRLGEGRIQGLEGHLRYRICLRTFSAAESSAVLGTPDAFYLPSFPGIGYFKVDTTIYRQFKTALISIPSTGTALAGDVPLIREFTPTGRLAVIDRDLRHAESGTTGQASLQTEMDVVIEQLRRNMPALAPSHQVLLPPLPQRLSLGEVLRHAGATPFVAPPPLGDLRIPIGLADNPAEQAQLPYVVDFSGAGGHLVLVGAPQSGKSTTLQAIIASFIATHSPRDVQISAIDLGGGSLRAFADAPHVGSICGKGERDMMRRLVRQMRGIIEERELLFRAQRIDGIVTYRARRRAGEFADNPYGDAFLIIDDLAQLQADIEGIDAEIVDLAATGLAYGVHLIVATNRWADVRARLRDNIGTRLELRLNDPAESEMGKVAALSLAQAAPGRVIVKGGMQFQVALPALAPAGATIKSQEIDDLIRQARNAWPGVNAPQVRMLPPLVLANALPATAGNGVPIGIDEFQLAPVTIDLVTQGPHFIIFGDGESGKTTLLRTWRLGIEQRFTPDQARFSVVDFRRTMLDALESPNLLAYAGAPGMMKDLIDQLKRELEPRMMGSGNITIEDLRNPKQWTGPQHYLLVDDYESIVAPAGNPLAPLLDAIAQGRDIGFHVILARRVSGTTRTAFEPLFQRIKELGSSGLILSGDAQEGALLGTQRATALPPGRGYLVRRNQRTMLVQTIMSEAPVSSGGAYGA